MKKLILFMGFILFLVSCQTEDEKNEVVNFQEIDSCEIVLKERDPSLPLILSKRDTSKRSVLKSALTFRELLGYSYKTISEPIGIGGANIGFSFIDINKWDRENPGYISERGLREAEVNVYSYTNFYRYTNNSKVDKKINTGFTLNLGLFSLGKTKSMQEVFTSSLVSEETAVLGEMNVEVKDGIHVFQTSSNIINKIKFDYLNKTFLDELYNTHPSELFSNYGGFVLTSFITGGRATAVYVGSHGSVESSEIKEKNMNTDITASYGFDYKVENDGKISGNLGIGKNFYNANTTSNKITNLKSSIKTIGGAYGFTSFSVPKGISDLNIDLSGWMNSLNDKSTHQIIDIPEGGLVPITAFLIEANFKDRFNDYYTHGDPSIVRLIEPYIRIIDFGSPTHILMISLMNRYGDIIWLPFVYDITTGVEEAIEAAKQKYSKYGIKVVFKRVSNPNEIFTKDYHYFLDGKGFELDKAEKYIDSKTNTIYILAGDKNGLSIHDDYILDTYGLRGYVNSLPVKQMNRDDLSNYKIIAL